MNRPIEFRCWRVEDGVVEPDSLEIDPMWGYTSCTRLSTPFNKSWLLYEQYTGLDDVNDTQIYEGDIVTCEGWKSSGELPAALLSYYLDREADDTVDEVVFQDGCFGVIADKYPNYGEFIPLSQFNDVCTVIGNKHQNPELCKKDEKI